MTYSTFLRPLLLLSLAGCTVLQDVDQFETDEGCDLVLPLLEFGAHSNEITDGNIEVRHEFFIEVVQERDVGGQPRDIRDTLVYFDPLPGPNVTLNIPGAVLPVVGLEDGRPRIEFWADQGRDGINRPTGFNAADVSTDHSWAIPEACEIEPFLHRTDTFIDLTPTRDGDPAVPDLLDRGSDLVVRFRLPPADRPMLRNAAIRGILSRTLEVRVLGTFLEQGEEVVRPIAFARRRRVDEPPPEDSNQFDPTLTLEGVFDDGFDQAIVLVSFDVDNDDEGDFDVGTDALVVRNFAGATFQSCEADPDGDICGIQGVGGFTGFELRIDEMPGVPTEISSEEQALLEPWWFRTAP